IPAQSVAQSVAPSPAETPAPERASATEEAEEAHQRLRHDGLEGTPNPGATSTSRATTTASSRARDELSSIQEIGGEASRTTLRGSRRRRREERAHIWNEQIATLLQSEQIQELLETAIADAGSGSSLTLSHSQLQNLQREIFLKVKQLLANGELSDSSAQFFE